MTQLTLNAPVIITPRLLAGLQIGSAFVSIEYAGEDNGRIVYRYFIDLPDGTEHEGNDLRSGAMGGTLKDGLESLLAFLMACAEGYDYQQRTGRASDNALIFPEPIAAWASEHSDELSMLAYELEETPDCIVED